MRQAKNWFLNLGLMKKLMSLLVAAGMIPLIVVSILSLQTAQGEMEALAFNQLESVRQIKAAAVDRYFQRVRNQVQTMASNPVVVDAMSNFARSFYDVVPTAGDSTQMYRSVSAYYNKQFSQMFQEINEGASPPIPSMLAQMSGSSLALQYHYIGNSHFALGEKHLLDRGGPLGDSTEYHGLHEQFHPYMRDYLESFGYYDIFLVDLQRGNIVYSVFKELDYATSLRTGPYAETNFADAYRAGATLSAGTSVLVDYQSYLPSYDAGASFIASPIFIGGERIGVLVFQMPLEPVNTIMGDRAGMGETGESYLVGEDGLMRSDSYLDPVHHTVDASFRNPELGGVDTAAVTRAFDGETGTGIIIDYNGNPVLSAYDVIDLGDFKWAILAEIDESEAFSGIRKLQLTTLLVAAVALVLIVLAALSTSKMLANPIRRLSNAIREIQESQDYDVTLDVEFRDEVGEATDSFNGFLTVLKHTIEEQKQTLEVSSRAKQALRRATSCIMLADTNNNITYLNDTIIEMFEVNEVDIQKQMPGFSAASLLDSSMDIFSGVPEVQLALVEGQRSLYKTNLTIGDLAFQLTVTPVMDESGARTGSVLEWVERTREVAIEEEVGSIVASALSGDLSRRINLEGKTGFIENLSKGINELVSVSEQVLNDLAVVFGNMSRGDLRTRVERDYQGTYGQLKADANATIDQLTEVVREIKAVTGSVSTGAQEISNGNANLSQRTEEQASSLEQTAASMVQMTATVRQNAENATQADSLANEAKEKAERGGAVVGQAVTAMEEINSSSKRIADIILVIDEIAFQTNLLALNASVEAARAGDQGRGFAVVASEVRNLAGRSASAAQEIKELINDSVRKVDEGSRLVGESGQTLRDIIGSVQKVAAIISEISAACGEQSAGIDEVSKAIGCMDEMTQQNAALVEEAAAASEAMGDQANSLDKRMQFFTIDEAATDDSSRSAA